MLRRVFLALLLVSVVSSCGNSVSTAKQLELSTQDGEVDLSEKFSGNWDTVCILPPYSTNEHAKAVLGVPLSVETKSKITSSDSIILIVTMQRGRVAGLYEIPRRNIDFTALGSKCYLRRDTKFTVSEDGHPFARHS
jgi:hypothetical protein